MKKIIFLITGFFFYITYGYTQAGKLDRTFGNNGIVKANLGSTYDYGYGMREVLAQSDGSMYVIFEREGQTLFTKRLATGLIDSSFGQNGFSSAVPMIEEHAVLQQDGKIVVAGYTNFGTSRDFEVARFNTNGSLDKSFSKDGKQIIHFLSDSYATTLAIQSDGKIVVAGYTTTLDDTGESSSDFALARFNKDGTYDKSFSDDGMQVSALSYTDDIPTSIAIQDDGKIVVAGYSSINDQYEKTSFVAIARYNTDGSVDDSFSVDSQNFGFLNAYPNSVVIQSDGKIVIAGQSKTLTGVDNETTTTDIFVARYNTDGKLDKTFGDNGAHKTDLGSDNNDNATVVRLQNDGKIVVLGSTWNGLNTDFALARYNTDGSIDGSFGTDGVQKTDFDNSEETASIIFVTTDGKIIVAGSSNSTSFSIAHYNNDGSLDTAFDGDGKFSQSFKSTSQGSTIYTGTAIQKDGKMIAVGNTWNGKNTNFVVTRYNTDGSLDTTFNHTGVQIADFGVFKDGATSVAIQEDGKIVAGGYTSDQDGSHFAIARYNPDGTFDKSFGGDGTPRPDLTELGRINAVVVQNDGKILATGNLWNGSNNDFGLVRYNPNGHLDSTFGIDGMLKTDFGSTEDNAKAMSLQADGKIVVAGLSNDYSNTQFVIIRYNSDGSVDSTFTGADAKVGDNDAVNALVIQNDGKVVVGGSIYSVDENNYSNSDFAVARFNTNGTLDTTFNHSGVTLIDVVNDDVINSLVIQNNGKIIAGGSSNNTISVVRFNTNGTIDSSFGSNGIQTTDASTSFNAIRGMAIYNNKLYAAGYGEYPGNLGLALRYSLDDSLMAPVVSMTTPVNDTVYSGPATIKISAIASDADGTIAKVEFYSDTTLIHTETVAPYGYDWVNVAAGNYTLTAKATDNSGLVTTSASVKISVVPHKAPTVSITNPANYQTIAGPATIHLKAAANDPEGTISKVEFYSGDSLLHRETVAPYTYTWLDVPVGKYTVTAKATNNFGLVTISSVIHISVVPNRAPTVSITNIANNQSFAAPATIPLVASAQDPDGTINKVEFYNGTTLLNTQYESPYAHNWTNVPAGVYTITAKAIDNLGLSKTSAPITIIVTAQDTTIVAGRKLLVNDLANGGSVNLRAWPNPASNIVNLSATGLPQNKQVTVSVISVSGVTLKTLQSNTSGQSIQLDVSSLKRGVYIIKVSYADKALYKQFVKL